MGDLSQVITRNDVKLLLSVISIIVVVTFAWSDLKNDARNAVKEASSAREETKAMAEKQSLMALDIREIKTILKQEGLTTSTYQLDPVAIAQPTPAAQSAQLTPAPQIVVNNVQPTPDVLPSPTPIPTPTPTPTHNPIVCLRGLCI